MRPIPLPSIEGDRKALSMLCRFVTRSLALLYWYQNVSGAFCTLLSLQPLCNRFKWLSTTLLLRLVHAPLETMEMLLLNQRSFWMPMARTVVNDGIHSLKSTANESEWIRMNLNSTSRYIERSASGSDAQIPSSELFHQCWSSGNLQHCFPVAQKPCRLSWAVSSCQGQQLRVLRVQVCQSLKQFTTEKNMRPHHAYAAHMNQSFHWSVYLTQIHAFRDANLQIATSCNHILRQKSWCHLSVSSREFSFIKAHNTIHTNMWVCAHSVCS